MQTKRCEVLRQINGVLRSFYGRWLPEGLKRAELLNLPARKRLKPNAIPSIFPFRSAQQNENNVRHKRVEQRDKKKKATEILAGRCFDMSIDASYVDKLYGWFHNDF